MQDLDIEKALLSKPEARLDYPFGADIKVFKVIDKMFATLSLKSGVYQMNLKCEPYRAAALRDIYASVLPGYHMNKLHWNTVVLDGSIDSETLRDMIDHSYAKVVRGMTKKIQNSLIFRYGEAQIFKGL